MKLGALRRVLREVERLPAGAAGVLRFGDRGTLLCDAGLVCWASATGARERLGELLRRQRNPPLPRRYLAEVVKTCRAESRPLGEALLATGEVTEKGLRAALFRQTCDAIERLAEGTERPTFTPLADDAVHYDHRFAFHPTEILVQIGSRGHKAMAVLATRELVSMGSTRPTVGFLCEQEHGPVAIAVRQPDGLCIDDLPAGQWGCALAALAEDAAGVAEGPPSPTGKRPLVWKSGPFCFLELPRNGSVEVHA